MGVPSPAVCARSVWLFVLKFKQDHSCDPLQSGGPYSVFTKHSLCSKGRCDKCVVAAGYSRSDILSFYICIILNNSFKYVGVDNKKPETPLTESQLLRSGKSSGDQSTRICDCSSASLQTKRCGTQRPRPHLNTPLLLSVCNPRVETMCDPWGLVSHPSLYINQIVLMLKKKSGRSAEPQLMAYLVSILKRWGRKICNGANPNV